MKITLLGQGYEPALDNSVGKNLVTFLADKAFHSFTAITAFSRLAGVNGLSVHIEKAKNHLSSITIITGVNQRGTTKEALEAILKLNINAYIFYAPKPFPIFHSKIYLFEGEQKSKLIIGSSNLTSTGLYSNIETSVLLSVDNSTKEDRNVIDQLKKYFKGIFDFNDPNLQKITPELIEGFVNKKIVITEAESKATRNKSESAETEETNAFISKIFPPRIASKIPTEFKGVKKQDKKPLKSTHTSKDKFSSKGQLVWTRKKLPASSVQKTPVGKDTGGLRLVQDNFKVDGVVIDQTNYFRDKIFKQFTWNKIKDKPFVEVTKVPFIVTIKDQNLGQIYLQIRHKPSGIAGQGNYTTSISWGEIGEIIKEANLTRLRLDLYAPNSKGEPFQIFIT